MLSFELPLIWLIAPLPLLAWRWIPPARERHSALPVPFFEQWAQLQGATTKTHTARPLTLAALIIIWCCLLAAASQPTWLGKPLNQTVSGREMLLAVDLSESMTIQDMEFKGQTIPRIDAVKAVVSDFVLRREGDKVGLILFGSKAYFHVPLTFDLNTLRTMLLEAHPGFAGKYTAIGDAIGLAVKRLLERPEQSRVVILLTDGANTAGKIEPIKAAQLAAEAGIKIHTIGVGANDMVLPGLFGSNLGARRVNPSADLDEETLQEIAQLTGGRYFRATNTHELNNIYYLLDELEPTGSDEFVFRPRASLAHWPLTAALALALALIAGRLLSGRLNWRVRA